jgi:hypothetical protein
MSSPNLTFRPDPGDLKAISAALDEFEKKVKIRIAKNALRQFAREEMSLISQQNSKWLNPKHMAYRVRYWPSGIIWLGVGYRDPAIKIKGKFYSNYAGSGRARRKAYDAEGVGWRSHFAELGWHSWSKGMTHPGTGSGSGLIQRGRGWKKGLRHRGRGTYHIGTGASRIVHQAFGPKVLPYLAREVEFEISKISKGRKARRQNVSRFL